MSKRNKNRFSSSQNPVQRPRDMFNVKENLKKLRSGTGKEDYVTVNVINNRSVSDKYYSTQQVDENISNSKTATTDRKSVV